MLRTAPRRVAVAAAAVLLLIPSTALAGVSRVTSLPLDHPISIAADGTRNLVYISRQANSINIVHGGTLRQLGTIVGPAGGSLTELATDPATNRLFALDPAHDALVVIDPASRRIVAQVPLPATPRGLAVNSKTNLVYVAVTAPAGSGQTRVSVVRGSPPFGVVANGPVWFGTARGIAVDTRTSFAYVSLDKPGLIDDIGVLDGVTNTSVPLPVPTVHVEGDVRGLAVDSGTNRLVVTDHTGDRVRLIRLDEFGFPTTNAFWAPAGDEPTAVTVNEATNDLYVANAGSGSPLASTGPFSIDGTLSVLAPLPAMRPTLEETVFLSRGTQAAAFDAANGRVFAANAGGPASGPIQASDGSVSVVSKFDPRAHGFHFVNRFDHAIVNLPVVGRVDLGALAFGLCGGMTAAALDDFLAGGSAPPDATPPGPLTALRAYLMQRQVDSLAQNDGAVILKFLEWMALPIHDNFLVTGLVTRTGREFVRRIHPDLVNGMPVPLGLVRASIDPLSRDFLKVFDNHQVLAIGDFQDPTGRWVIEIYDPNEPGRTSYLHIDRRVETSDPAGAFVIGGFRGFFEIPYSFEQPYWVSA